MVYRISKKDKLLKGTIHLPSSKSESNRALIIRSLCKKNIEIKNISRAEDSQILKKILSQKGKKNNGSMVYDIKASGTAMRFLTAYFSVQEGKKIILTGTPRMKERPVKILVDALKSFGAQIRYLEKEGYPPIEILGKSLSGGTIRVNGNISSQYISALLMIGPVLKNGLKINFSGKLVSMPYIEMTLKMMSHFGIEFQRGKKFISIKNQPYKPSGFSVESDWSAASYWYEMAAFSNEVDITLSNLKKESLQGDSIVPEFFKAFGISTSFSKYGIHLKKVPGQRVLPDRKKIDFTNYPDLAQTIAVTFAGLNVPLHLSGLKTLRIKETDRINALGGELGKFGVWSEIIKNDLYIKKSRIAPQSALVNTYNDHRMAMAFAPLAIIFGKIKLDDPLVVNKSYPGFWNDLKKVGFEIKIEKLNNSIF